MTRLLVDGPLPEPEPLEDKVMSEYRRHKWGPHIELAFTDKDSYEPEGEFWGEGVNVHIERMSKKSWFLLVIAPDGEEMAVEFYSDAAIHPLWRPGG